MGDGRSSGAAVVKKTIITYNVALATILVPAIIVMLVSRTHYVFWTAVALALLSPGIAGIIAYLVLKRSVGSGKT